jgi:DNA-binding GntR family transcriptional regulator
VTLAIYIQKDLKARILDGEESPGRITLRDLAERYGVSLTPVRQAVDVLVRERFICRESNGRLTINPKARPVSGRASKIGRPDPPRDWERVIGPDVMRRSLRGEEEFLREETAAERYGVGRTVLRRVFGRLAAGGLLEHIPRRGWRVRPLRKEEVEAYLQVREILEIKAMDLAREKLARTDLERIHGDNRPSGPSPRVDGELHAYIIGKCGNRYIQDFFRSHGAYYTTLFHYAAIEAPVAARMARRHQAILEAIMNERWDQARSLLSADAREQAPVLRKMMAHLASLPLEKWPDIPVLEGSGCVRYPGEKR